MIFEAEIGNYRTMADGRFKIPLKLNREAKRKVSPNISNFKDKPVIVNLINNEYSNQAEPEVLILNARFEDVSRTQKYYKLLIYADEEQEDKIMTEIHKFDDWEVSAELEVDIEERKKELNKITREQQKKIYAVINDIKTYTGYSAEEQKLELKRIYCEKEGYNLDDFSFAEITKNTAIDFIEFLGVYCLKKGIVLEEMNIRQLFDDIRKHVWLCLKLKKCAICGKTNDFGDSVNEHGQGQTQVQTHHIDTIGAGNDRTQLDDSDKRKISLCEVHHDEAEKMGWKNFSSKYHVKGVIYNE